ncbi:hypothetical protein MRB53_038411 [Persea americana]|nr:hypothetical protein MRB53_038411 [Persea americana]
MVNALSWSCATLASWHIKSATNTIVFSKYLPNVKTEVFYGGTPIAKDQEILGSKEDASSHCRWHPWTNQRPRPRQKASARKRAAFRARRMRQDAGSDWCVTRRSARIVD